MSLLKLSHVNYIYNKGTALESYALKDIDLSIDAGEFIGIIGRTGSGKSTLIQHLDGLLKPTEGQVFFDGEDICRKGYDLRTLRCKVGLVFQYPEYQLFETDVISDVMYGPKNMGLSLQEARKRAEEALDMVGLDASVYDKSPFEMSGGQRRRVAIAGVLAMMPQILVLDEPTAGLDPKGRDDILSRIRRLHDETGMGVVLVSHSMEDVARYVDRMIVVSEGKIAYDDIPRKVFMHTRELEEMGLAAPQMTYVVQRLRALGADIPEDLILVDEVKDAILRLVKK